MCNLVEELQKDFIDHQINQNNMSKEEAEDFWEMHNDCYLDNVFEEIARILGDLYEEETVIPH